MTDPPSDNEYPVPPSNASSGTPPQPFQLPDNSAEVAANAAAAGKAPDVREELAENLRRQVRLAGADATQQYRQAVLWRQWNIGLGLVAGALVAAAGASALFTHTAAAIIGMVATFATGALMTLNAGHRKSQAHAAGCAYQEVEDSARRLLNVELPYITLAEAIQRSNHLEAQRLQINRFAEPPTHFATRVTWSKRRKDRKGLSSPKVASTQ